MKNKFTALYCRVSTDNQVTGLESQVRALTDYCKRHEVAAFKIYEELGVSGAKTTRHVLDRMIQDCESGLIDSVIVYSFSRFARSTKHLILALEQFDKLKIRFISITENIDTQTAFGRTVFQIIASISELERELVRDRVRTGLKNARAKGRQIGGKPKFTNLEVIKELSDKGSTTREIARVLKMSQSTVSRALKKLESTTLIMNRVSDKCS